MTCGMLCVMRREGRGVLNLGEYSPSKGSCSVEEERKREKKKKKKEERRKTTEKERELAVL